MMINLQDRAEELANRNYQIDIEQDTLSDGEAVYVARNPELPGCKAQGESIEEAIASLNEVRVEYILALLEEGLLLPEIPNLVATPLSKQEVDKYVTTVSFVFNDGNIQTRSNSMGDNVIHVIQPDHTNLHYPIVKQENENLKRA